MKDIIFNQNIHEHESAFSENVWSGVANGLEKEKKKRLILIWITSIFFALMVLSLAAYFGQNETSKASDVKFEIRNQTPDVTAPVP